MRPGQNKRMRGRPNNSNNRKGPNPLTRSYESNGPDVKIRGTAHHVAEKYLQLARDAQSSGDPVMAESYLQHAEHYFRIIATAQAAQLLAQQGYNRSPNDADIDDMDDDDDFGGIPDRFASPTPPERFTPPFNAQPAPNFTQQPQPQQPPFPDRQNYNGNGNGGGMQDRGGQDRGGQDRGGQDRGGQDRQQDRQGSGDRQERFDRGQRPDRPYQDRPNNFRDRNNRDQRNNRFEGSRQERFEQRGNGEQPRAAYGSDQQQRSEQPRQDRQDHQEQLPARQMQAPVAADIDVPTGLPSFITAPVPVRQSQAVERDADQSVLNGAHGGAQAADEPRLGGESGDESGGFAPRPRRRRRPRVGTEEGGGFAAEGEGVTASTDARAHKETTGE